MNDEIYKRSLNKTTDLGYSDMMTSVHCHVPIGQFLWSVLLSSSN